jgi:hypothetical protein
MRGEVAEANFDGQCGQTLPRLRVAMATKALANQARIVCSFRLAELWCENAIADGMLT